MPSRVLPTGYLVRVDLDSEAVRSNLSTELVNLFARESRKLIRLHIVQGEQTEAKSYHPELVKIGV